MNANQKALLFAGVVGGGLLWVGLKKESKCKTFNGIWAERTASGGLNLTKEVQDTSYAWTRSHVASLFLAGDPPNIENTTLDLANHIQECDWERAVKTKRGKQVWTSLSKIVGQVYSEAGSMGVEEFIKKYGGS